MEYSGVWAIPFHSAEEFFRKHAEEKEHFFQYKNCIIRVEKLPEKGILNIPQTKVSMQGREEDTKEIHKKFFLNFLSAGG